MPLRLLDTYPDGYEWHNSAAEHWGKHVGDIGRIDALRAARGLSPLVRSGTVRAMRNGGIVAISELLEGGGMGDVVGYVAANREDDTIDVEDFFVLEQHRGKGLGGAILGDLVTKADIATPALGIHTINYARLLEIGGHTLRLPGMHLYLNELNLPDGWIDGFVQNMKEDPHWKHWTGVRTIDAGEHLGHVVFREGAQIGQIEYREGGYGIADRPDSLTHRQVAFAAIELLNGPIPWLSESANSQAARH